MSLTALAASLGTELKERQVSFPVVSRGFQGKWVICHSCTLGIEPGLYCCPEAGFLCLGHLQEWLDGKFGEGMSGKQRPRETGGGLGAELGKGSAHAVRGV